MHTSTSPSIIHFKEPHSLSIRIWHWVTYLALTASLVTVLLGSTMFKTRNNITMVHDLLQEKGATVTKDQARAVAHEYGDMMWNTHKIIGYVLCGLLLSRLIIEIAQPGEEKLRVKIKKVLALHPTIMEEKSEQKHYLFVKRGYLFFYGSLLIMSLTGLGLAFEDAPYLRDIQEPISSIHSFVQYFIYAYILMHITGVLLAESGKYNGIISRMFNGGRE